MAPSSRMAQRLRWLARPLAIVSIWLIAAGFFGTAYVIGTGRRLPRQMEVPNFIGAFAVSAIVSAVVALFLGGRRRWAVEAVLSISILIVTPIASAYAMFWLVPTFGQSLLGMMPRDFLSYRRDMQESAREIAGFAVPAGTVLGILVGTIAGLVLVLAGRWPRFVGGLVVGLLLACAIASVHINLFDVVIDLVVQTRLHGIDRAYHAWLMTSEVASAIGATAGAVVGAVISCWAVRMGVRSRRTATGRPGAGPGL